MLTKTYIIMLASYAILKVTAKVWTNIQYNPMIMMNRVTGMSMVFYGAYAVLLLLPMGLQMIGEKRFSAAPSKKA